MRPWESIVIGVDFSNASKPALREAARLAQWHQARLHLAHVVTFAKNHNDSSKTSAAISLIRHRVEQSLKDLVSAELEFPGVIDLHIMVGQHSRELCQLTDDVEADLLVLGSRSISANHEAPITINCITKAPAPVLIVRTPEDHHDPAILAAINFSPASLNAARMAAEIAFKEECRLHLVQVFSPEQVPPFAEIREYERIETQLNQCQAALQSRFKELPITAHLIKKPKFTDALVSFITEHQITLAVLGTDGAEQLLQTCPCSMLAVKEAGAHVHL